MPHIEKSQRVHGSLKRCPFSCRLKTKETRTLSHEHNNTPKGAINSVCPVHRCNINRVHVRVFCLSIHVSITILPQWRPQFLSDLPEIRNVGHTDDNEDQVRWPITLEIVNVQALQFTCNLAHF